MSRRAKEKKKKEKGSCPADILESALSRVSECVIIGSRDGSIRFVNKPFICKSGLDRQEIELLVADKHVDKQVTSCINTLVSQIQTGEPYHETIPFETLEGVTAFVEVDLEYHKVKGQDDFFIATLKDISEKKKTENQLRETIYTDELTGLPNRNQFLKFVGIAISRFRENPDENSFSVVLLDLDRFKILNDGLGHEAGNNLLISISERLSAALPDGYVLARMVGAQLAVLSPVGTDVEEANRICGYIQNALKEPISTDGRAIYMTASLGIAVATLNANKPEDILLDAETAMYSAKRAGGAQSVVFKEPMRANFQEKFELETDLYRAMQHGEFTTYFQPIVSLRTGKTASFEALIRWNHPQKGLVFPAGFLPTAEETRLIIPIGLQVFEMTCAHLKQWKATNPKADGVTVSVNISGVQFQHPELVPQLDLIIRKQGLRPQDIKLEITESILLEHADHAEAMLNQFKAMGFNLCIDDFGTGYASFSYLNNYPIETVKIDQSFVRQMATDPASHRLVKTMVAMAHDLGKEVVIEGVETTEQLSKARALLCEYVQGFLFSKAVDNNESAEMIAKRWYC